MAEKDFKGNQLSKEALKMMLKKGIPPQVINMIRAGKPTPALYELSIHRMLEREDTS